MSYLLNKLVRMLSITKAELNDGELMLTYINDWFENGLIDYNEHQQLIRELS